MAEIDIYYKSIRDARISKIKKFKKGCFMVIDTTNPDDLLPLARDLGLDHGLLCDGIDLYESPRLERDANATYIFVRYCEPSGSETSTEPLLLVSTSEALIAISRKPVASIDTLLASGEAVTTQKIKMMLQLLTLINKSYRNYVNSVTKRIFSARNKLEKRKLINNNDILKFIDLEEDLNEFLAALQPYSILLNTMVGGKYFALHEGDKDLIADIVLSTNELIDLSKSRLKTMQNIRESYTTIATNNLNKIFTRLTSITIFLMIPTIISGLYGMNISLPFQNKAEAFSIVLILTVLIVLSLVAIFKKQRWL